MRLGCAWLALGLLLHLNLHLDVGLAANILGVFPYRLPSPFQMVRPLVKALVKRGHSVTMITPLGYLPDIEGVRHIRVPELNILQMSSCRGTEPAAKSKDNCGFYCFRC